MAGRRRLARIWIPGLVAGLVAWDLIPVDRTEGNRTIIVPEVDTEALGPTQVVIASSQDLPEPVPLDQELTYAQVDAIVKRAIHLDISDRNLAVTIEPGRTRTTRGSPGTSVPTRGTTCRRRCWR